MTFARTMPASAASAPDGHRELRLLGLQKRRNPWDVDSCASIDHRESEPAPRASMASRRGVGVSSTSTRVRTAAQ